MESNSTPSLNSASTDSLDYDKKVAQLAEKTKKFLMSEITDSGDEKEEVEENSKNNKQENRLSRTIVKTKADRHGNSKSAELVWELPNKQMTKNEMFSKNIPLKKRGNYQLIFTKLDAIMLRTLSIRVKIYQNGKEVLNGKAGIGGVKWTKSHCMEFQISQPADLAISLKCCNATSIGKIAFKINLVCSYKKKILYIFSNF